MGTTNAASKASRFDAVQSLRFLCFLIVFGVHAGCLDLPSAAIILQVFIILSGFMLTYAYSNRELQAGPIKNFKFAVGKMKKMYPLHAITTVIQYVILVFYFIYMAQQWMPDIFDGPAFGLTGSIILQRLPYFFLHMGLLHAWVPDETVNFMFNGPSWYLSVTVFLYFVFPWICKLVKKINSKKILITIGAVSLIILYIASYFANVYDPTETAQISHYVMLHCPLLQIPVFLIGCIFGKLYLDWRNKQPDGAGNAELTTSKKLLWTLFEIGPFLAFVGITIGLLNPVNVPGFESLAFFGTFGFALVSLWFVFVFIMNRGYVTKILGNKLFVYLGDISAYTYLTHYIFTLGWSDLTEILRIENTGVVLWVSTAIEFILSIATGMLCNYLMKRSAKKKKMKQQGIQQN
ncbi:MAG: acyltransferase [Lachnospiraceae bacterium]|nr:acyltransferase [Candidatus Merdinaster equi]